MKYPALFWLRNNTLINFLIVWWIILSRLFSWIFIRKDSEICKNKTSSIESKEKQVISIKSSDTNELIHNEYQELISDGITSRFFNFVPERDIKFYLFTRNNSTIPQVIQYNDSSALKKSNFNSKMPIRFLIHGWLDNGLGELGTAGRKAYLQKGEFNVISVDWSIGADTANYFKARDILYQVGPLLGKYVDFLVNNAKITTSKVYLIGHSLGAHIAGIAGKCVKSGKINSIIGLDPAGPLFFTFKPNERLDVNDAAYVEVVHTSYQGFGKPIGYADFYANGGKIQPGCKIFTSCSHMRSIAYWAESINTETAFWATPMENTSIFDNFIDPERKIAKMGGEPCNEGKAKGLYKLVTASSSPFALGKKFTDVAT